MSRVSASTFATLLSTLLRTDASRPLVTFYDDATGERIELSGATYVNWVNKTAALVQDEMGVERGGLVLLDLPTHWLGTVWLGAAWTLGLCATADRARAEAADLVVCGPERVLEYAPRAERSQVVALSLRPLGGRFVDALPTGVLDYGAVVLAQPDTWVSYDPAQAADPAWQEGPVVRTQAELLAATAAEPLIAPGGRLLTDVNPCASAGLSTLLSAVAQAGAGVWVANPDMSLWDHRYAEERATAQLRAPAPR